MVLGVSAPIGRECGRRHRKGPELCFWWCVCVLGWLKCPEAAVGPAWAPEPSLARALPGTVAPWGTRPLAAALPSMASFTPPPKTVSLSPASPTKNASFHHLCLSLLKLGIKFQFPVRKNVRLALRVSSVASPERPVPAMPRPNTHALCRQPLPGTRGQRQASESRPSFFQKRASHL